MWEENREWSNKLELKEYVVILIFLMFFFYGYANFIFKLVQPFFWLE